LITRVCRRKQNNGYVDVKIAGMELICDVREYAGYPNNHFSHMFDYADKELYRSLGFSKHSKVGAYMLIHMHTPVNITPI
jgi:hypothetical protein